MPQVDVATFGPIVLWTSLLYIGGYLFLSATYLYQFFSQLKLNIKRSVHTYQLARAKQRLASTLTLFPWIAL